LEYTYCWIFKVYGSFSPPTFGPLSGHYFI
jgi:hypothetical protein